jgi:lysophospholipase L1-like esterase
MQPRILGTIVLLLIANLAQAQGLTLPQKFAAQVVAYEAEDRALPPPHNAILFAGDSQFFRWATIRADLPGYTLINRGVDSFQFEHLIQYADQLVLRYQPRLVVLHVGGNDIHNGKTPERVLEDFKTLVAALRARLPRVPIVYSSITPSPGRWEEAPQRRTANRLIREYAATQSGLTFIDLWDALLTADAQPREDLWVADRVHPNHAGYLIRAELTRPALGSPDMNP